MNKVSALQSFAGFDDFLGYLAISAALLAVFLALYVRITPYREIALIRDGNRAAAYSLAGTLIGMAIPLASAIEHSVNPIDMAIWGAIALAVQVIVYGLARLALPDIARDIPAGKEAAGIFVGAVSLAAGILNAACMTY
jgi:putative membrane protein